MEQMDTNLLQSKNQPPAPESKFLHYAVMAVAILIILGSVAYSSSLLFGQTSNNSPVAETSKKPGFFTQIKNLILSSERELKGQAEDRINILLLGIGGEGHDGPYLTDTIILASIKPSTKQVALLSIPRDLLMLIPGYGYRKINNADAFGESKTPGSGPVFASEVISQTLDIPIHYYIRADFQAFKDIVDRLGGIRVYVDKSFTDYTFPAADYKVKTISFEPGWQTMDGETALNFARSRHGTNGESNDFARSHRQQKILLAVKNKVSSSFFFTAGKIQDILSSLEKHVNTNMEWWEIAGFYKLTKNLDYENMINRVLEDGPGKPLVQSRYGDAEVLEPRHDNFDEIKQITRNIFSEETAKAPVAEPANTARGRSLDPVIEIQNGTWLFGLAAKTKVELETKGVKITNIGNAQARDYSKTVIYDMSAGRFKKELNQIKDLLGAEIKSPPEALTVASSTPDILIIIGADKKTE